MRSRLRPAFPATHRMIQHRTRPCCSRWVLLGASGWLVVSTQRNRLFQIGNLTRVKGRLYPVLCHALCLHWTRSLDCGEESLIEATALIKRAIGHLERFFLPAMTECSRVISIVELKKSTTKQKSKLTKQNHQAVCHLSFAAVRRSSLRTSLSKAKGCSFGFSSLHCNLVRTPPVN